MGGLADDTGKSQTDGERLRELLGAKSASKQQHTSHTILVGDCMEGLKTLADNSVHLIVTSPPYNVGKNYAQWNDRLPYEDYLDFLRAWMVECLRVLIPGECICVNLPVADFGGRLAFIDIYHLLRQAGFWHQDLIAWVKWSGKAIDTSGFAVSKRKVFSKRRRRKLIDAFEVILVLRKPTEDKNQQKELNVDPVDASEMNFNIWHITPTWDKAHPAPFPDELPRRLIRLYSQEGDVILDPFLGTGTTMKVAQEMKRNAIGCELNPEYIDLILKRLRFPIRVFHILTPTQTPLHGNNH